MVFFAVVFLLFFIFLLYAFYLFVSGGIALLLTGLGWLLLPLLIIFGGFYLLAAQHGRAKHGKNWWRRM